PPTSSNLHDLASSPSRLHLYDDPIVVDARTLLTEGRVLELQLQVVVGEEVLHAPCIACDPVGSRAVVRVELLHATDQLQPLRHHTVGPERIPAQSRYAGDRAVAREELASDGDASAVDHRLRVPRRGVGLCGGRHAQVDTLGGSNDGAPHVKEALVPI